MWILSFYDLLRNLFVAKKWFTHFYFHPVIILINEATQFFLLKITLPCLQTASYISFQASKTLSLSLHSPFVFWSNAIFFATILHHSNKFMRSGPNFEWEENQNLKLCWTTNISIWIEHLYPYASFVQAKSIINRKRTQSKKLHRYD